MSEFQYILLFVLLIIGLNYIVLIFTFTLGWYKIEEFDKKYNIDKLKTKISIIISFRNEESNIINCLNSIINQNFPLKLMEIILIDDHSNDSSLALVKEFKQNHLNNEIKIIELGILHPIIGSKKLAIKEGISIACGELIITTDADCIVKCNWLKEIVSYYETYNPTMIVAPVSFKNTDTIFKRMQHLEFLSLQAIGLASIGLNHPILANGANLAYKKEAFILLKGFKGNEHIATGDDVFLLHQINKAYPDSIHYLKSDEAIVYTNPQKNIVDFINQRVRWASKSKYFKDIFAKYVSLSVLLLNISLLLVLILSIISPKLLILFCILLIVKAIFDFPLLFNITSFFKEKKLLFLVPLLSFIYIFYVCIVSYKVFWGKYKWKDREIKC